MPGNDLAIGVEIGGVYDGISVYLHSDGRIVNRWADGDWAGSTRWAATEDYIEKNRDGLVALIQKHLPSADRADGDDQQRNAEDG